MWIHEIDWSDWLYSYSSTQTIHNISFYIESLWFEYELCVISDNLSFNVSHSNHHFIWYIIHPLYQHLLFTSTHSTIYTLSERWYRDEQWMIRRETVYSIETSLLLWSIIIILVLNPLHCISLLHQSYCFIISCFFWFHKQSHSISLNKLFVSFLEVL